jgi:hypothetical protein
VRAHGELSWDDSVRLISAQQHGGSVTVAVDTRRGGRVGLAQAAAGLADERARR